MPGEATVQNRLLDLLAPGGCLTMDELDAAGELTRRQIGKAVGQLIHRGLVERVEAGCYQITDEGRQALRNGLVITSGPHRPLTGQRRPRKDTFRARIWRAMRTMRTFTIPDLLMMAGDGIRNGRNSADVYVRRLAQAGYVVATPRRAPGTAPTSNGFKVWLLVRDTGHLHPLVCVKARMVFDQNTGETFAYGDQP